MSHFKKCLPRVQPQASSDGRHMERAARKGGTEGRRERCKTTARCVFWNRKLPLEFRKGREKNGLDIPGRTDRHGQRHGHGKEDSVRALTVRRVACLEQVTLGDCSQLGKWTPILVSSGHPITLLASLVKI